MRLVYSFVLTALLSSLLPSNDAFVVQSVITPKNGLQQHHHQHHHQHQQQHHNTLSLKSYNTNINSNEQQPHFDLNPNHSNDDDQVQEQIQVQVEGTSSSLSRRNALQNISSRFVTSVTSATLTTGAFAPKPAIANEVDTQSSTAAAASVASAALVSPPITHKVNFNVRISRADGTFYVRDDPPGTIPTPDNQVYTGTITLGLYGTYAPNHVAKFLQYAGTSSMTSSSNSNNNSAAAIVGVGYDFDDGALPNYSRSMFTTFLQSNGVLIGGTIPGLQLTSLSGAAALGYRGRITPATLWIDTMSTSPKISHTKRGLLTHRNLDVMPDFGITTRDDTRELDATHTVFGEVLPTDSSAAFFRRIVDLPTYSNVAAAPSVGVSMGGGGAGGNGNSSRAAEEVTSSIYSFQKDLFRSAAKSFGDSRLDNVYVGKILRRVEVTSISVETL